MKNLAAFSGVLAAVALAPLAHASFELSYQVDGGVIHSCDLTIKDTFASCLATTTTLAPGTTGAVFTALSNSPGDVVAATQSGSLLRLQAPAHTVVNLWMAAQDFTMPTTPPGVDTLSTSLTIIPTRGRGTAALENCVDESNGTAPPAGVFCSAPGLVVNDSVNFSGSTAVVDNNSGKIASVSTPFSLSQEVTITFDTDAVIQIQTRQSLSAIAEPASVGLLGTLLVGIAAMFRKKAARQA